jgi:hypothetical protein
MRSARRTDVTDMFYGMRLLDALISLQSPLFHISIFFTIHLSTILANSKQSPSWEAISFSASEEILRILWNQKFHYRIY